MEDSLNSLNEVELQSLLKLADSPEFHVLQKWHRTIINKMLLIAFNRIDITDEDKKQHAIQLGHAISTALGVKITTYPKPSQTPLEPDATFQKRFWKKPSWERMMAYAQASKRPHL